MSFDKKTLFELLPAFIRIRDTSLALKDGVSGDIEKEGPVQALLALVAEQVAVLEENLDQLYDDQFIETCANWVVPYIGELVAARGLNTFPGARFSQRSQAANTIAYRRRKGTASMLEQLAFDVTGWNANVVEYFELLATTQYLNHLRPKNLSVTDLRPKIAMQYVNTPFDRHARTADVRRIESKRGKYNIHHTGIFLWRLDAYSQLHSPAYKVDAARYKFDILGRDIQLYNMPQREDEITHLAQPVNVPMPIKRLIMREYPGDYYGPGKSVMIYHDGALPFPPDDAGMLSSICICNLSDKSDGSGDWCNMPAGKIAIDPVLGRIAFPPASLPSVVQVDYHYGFSDQMSGGDYSRISSFQPELEKIKKIRVPEDQASISLALAALESTGGVVEISDNELYVEALTIRVAQGKIIEIRAANLKRPALLPAGEISITGGENSKVFINGLLIGHSCLRLPLNDDTGAANQLEVLGILHCTILGNTIPTADSPPEQQQQPALIVEIPGVQVNIDRSIISPIQINEDAKLSIRGSVIDAGSEDLVAYSGPGTRYGAPLVIENTTVIGRVSTRIMELASNTIFYSGTDLSGINPFPVEAQRLQEGCVRFSYIPPGSRLPRPYNCQPADEASATRIRPVFNSLLYGKAAYCQLSAHCATEITQGADDGAEMGAFHDLYQPQREMNLKTRLNEYLRFGLEAGIFYGS
ncbi:MAG: hypothetical protein ABW007_09745 [Chitinophagaceae bacterium]